MERAGRLAPVKIAVEIAGRVLEVTVAREDGHYLVEVEGTRRLVDARKLEGDFYSILDGGRSYEVSVEADHETYRVRHGAAEQVVTITDASRGAREAFAAQAGPARVATMMPGRVVRVLVAEGDTVEAGQGLVVVEAMKMENEIPAPRGGRVAAVQVEAGQAVEGGAVLAVIE
jgi:biotin carboxyl carrier protein